MSTTTSGYVSQFYDVASEIASRATDEQFAAHGIDWDADFVNVDSVGRQRISRCKCGREFKTNNGRGLHIAAEQRKARREWDRIFDETVAALRAGTMIMLDEKSVVAVESVEYTHDAKCRKCVALAAKAYISARVTGSVGATYGDTEHSAKVARAFTLSDDGYEIKRYI